MKRPCTTIAGKSYKSAICRNLRARPAPLPQLSPPPMKWTTSIPRSHRPTDRRHQRLHRRARKGGGQGRDPQSPYMCRLRTFRSITRVRRHNRRGQPCRETTPTTKRQDRRRAPSPNRPGRTGRATRWKPGTPCGHLRNCSSLTSH